MKIVSISQIIELNELLQKENLQFKVHLRDACGAQSFYVEQLDSSSGEGKLEELHQTLEQYFKNNNMNVAYYDKTNFTIK